MAEKPTYQELERRVAELEAQRELQTTRTAALDISGCRRLEEALRESEGRLRFALETSRTGTWSMNLVDKRGIGSLEHDRIFGYASLLPEWTYQTFLDHVLPEDREMADEKFRSAVQRQTNFSLECRIRRIDGEIRWIWAAGRYPVEVGGEPPRMAGIVQDITERKQGEQKLAAALKEAEEGRRLLEALMEHVPEGITIADAPDVRIRMVSRAGRELTGRPREVIEGIGVEEHAARWDLYYADGVTPARNEDLPLTRAVQKGEVVLGEEWVLRTPDGRQIPILCNAGPILDAEGRVTSGIIVWRDVSDRKRALNGLRNANLELERQVERRTAELAQQAAQLRALARELTLSEQRERRRMAQMLHDHLQQLLVGAKFRVTVLKRHFDPLVLETTQEIEQLIDACIQASRSLTAELSPPIMHEEGLNAGLEWLARWMADNHGLVIDLFMDEVPAPQAEDVKVLLFESIRELLFNVVKHSRTRSATVKLRCNSDQLEVVVSDQGVGFDPNAIPPAGLKGGGFGLFSVRERLHLVGGRLEIESAPGKGSRFVMTAPLGPPSPLEPDPLEADLFDAAGRKK
jgi:PAS domain S-box-containing protein